jgi:hypothetical protein
MSAASGRNVTYAGATPAAPATDVADPATRQALSRLTSSRDTLRRWATTVGTEQAPEGSGFKPRSRTMRALLAVGGKRLRWLGPAYSAWSMLRAFRRPS